MANERGASEGFRVVDRRLFNEEGRLRDDVKEEPKSPSAGSAPVTQRDTAPGPAPSAAAHEEPAGSFEEPASDFETLVSYLSTTAMFQLGLLPGPSGERIPADLPNAGRTIDLLGVLQQKTRGNLTPEEARLLEDVLSDLHMGYIEVESHLQKKRK